MEKWRKLQNGSDIRGVALEGVAGESVNLTQTEAMMIGYGFYTWLKQKKQSEAPLKVTVGHDSRLSAEVLKKGVFAGIAAAGGQPVDCGLATTPSLFMSTIFEDVKADGAIMITASHLPFNRNGLKFFTCEGGLDKPDISAILAHCADAEEKNLLNYSEAVVESYDLISRYSSHLVTLIRGGINDSNNYEQPLKGFKVIVDAGNGAGGFFAAKVLQPLGADTAGSQFLEPDGMFPNHQPNPEDPAAMTAITEATKAAQADLGVIFDTDVDRSAVVLSDGSEINRNRLIAMMSAIVLAEQPGSTIVTDSVTSDGLAEFITALGGKHHRFKRGYKNVINESVRLNAEGIESALAIETSGHGALKENYFLDDGAYMVVKILIEMARAKKNGKALADLVSSLEEPLESTEIRVKILYDDFKVIGERIIEDLRGHAAFFSGWMPVPDNHEGIRFKCLADNEDGWFLIRMSLHDPVIPINVESNVKGGTKEIAFKIYSILDNYDHLDLSGFDKVFLQK